MEKNAELKKAISLTELNKLAPEFKCMMVRAVREVSTKYGKRPIVALACNDGSKTEELEVWGNGFWKDLKPGQFIKLEVKTYKEHECFVPGMLDFPF